MWCNRSSAPSPPSPGLAGYTAEVMSSYPAVVTNIGTMGFRTTYDLPEYTVIQEVVINGTVPADTNVRHTVTVQNTSGLPREFGVRFMWDWMIAGYDSSLFKPRNPDGIFTDVFTAYLSPDFSCYEETDDSGTPVFSVFGTVQGGGLDPAPTSPEELRYCAWGVSFFSAWDFTNIGGGADSAVVYYWGKSAPLALPVGASMSFTQYVTTELLAISSIPVLRKRVTPAGVVSRGETVTYVVSWSNAGQLSLLNLTITDTLPSGVFYAGAILGFYAEPDSLGTPALLGSAYAPSSGGLWTDGEPPGGTGSPLVLRWVIDRVEPGKSGSIRFDVKVSVTLLDGSIVANRASATMAAESAVVESGDVSTTVFIMDPVLQVTKTAPLEVRMGTDFTFALSVSNTGMHTAFGLIVVDTLPPPLRLVAASGTVTVAGDVLAWHVDRLDPGQSFTVTVTASGPDAAADYDVTNTARADFLNRKYGGVPQPPVTGDAAVRLVTPKPVMTLDKQGPEGVETRTPFTFTILVANAGSDTAYDVLVVDTLPPPLLLIGATESPVVTGNVVAWMIDSIPPGGSRQMAVTVRGPKDDGDYSVTNVAHAAAWTRPGGGFQRPPVADEATVLLRPVLVMRVFPQPYEPGRAVRGTLKFSGVPHDSVVYIYTVGGMLVGRLENPVRHRLEWDGLNQEGSEAAPGIYLYVIEYPDGRGGKKHVRGKFGLIR